MSCSGLCLLATQVQSLIPPRLYGIQLRSALEQILYPRSTGFCSHFTLLSPARPPCQGECSENDLLDSGRGPLQLVLLSYPEPDRVEEKKIFKATHAANLEAPGIPKKEFAGENNGCEEVPSMMSFWMKRPQA